MTDAGLDRETASAVAALVYRLRNRDGADDEPFAQEFITALKQRGWRPTQARPLPEWNRQHGGSGPTEEWRQARAELDARLGVSKPEGAA